MRTVSDIGTGAPATTCTSQPAPAIPRLAAVNPKNPAALSLQPPPGFDPSCLAHAPFQAVPELPAPKASKRWEAAQFNTPVPVLLSMLDSVCDKSLLSSLENANQTLDVVKRDQLQTIKDQQAAEKGIAEQRQKMKPGEIAQLVVSAVVLLLGILVPAIGPALTSIALASLVAGNVASGFFLSMGIADRVIKDDSNKLTRLDGKGEKISLQGMSIAVLVDMVFDAAVRDGVIVINGEDNGKQALPGAAHMSRDEFDQAKQVWSTVVTVVIIVLPLVLSLGAAAQSAGGLAALLKSLPERLKSSLQEIAAGIKSIGGKLSAATNLTQESALAGMTTERVLENATSVFQTCERLAKTSQGSLGIYQNGLQLQLGKLNLNLGVAQKARMQAEGLIRINTESMQFTTSVYENMLKTQTDLARTLATIIQQMNEPGLSAARNIRANT